MDPDKRKDFASNLNKIKDDLSSQIEQKVIEIDNTEINDKLKNEKVDITLPIRPYQPVSYTHLTLPTTPYV